jgi:hypothetical protein
MSGKFLEGHGRTTQPHFNLGNTSTTEPTQCTVTFVFSGQTNMSALWPDPLPQMESPKKQAARPLVVALSPVKGNKSSESSSEEELEASPFKVNKSPFTSLPSPTPTQPITPLSAFFKSSGTPPASPNSPYASPFKVDDLRLWVKLP